MNCQKAKNINLVMYLKKHGFIPQKTKGENTWFLSPFRKEKTASFKVDSNKNIWYDFGDDSGGTIIDFLQKLHKCSISEVLEKLTSDTFSFHQQPKLNSTITKAYSIDNAREISNYNLLNYLNERKIKISIAKKYCFQVHYSFENNRQYYGIGFMNDIGSFEIRNKYFKGCLGKKAITTIFNHSNTVCIFESFTDFLSYLTLKKTASKENYIITNSTSLVKNCIELIKDYKHVKTYFDNDTSGQNSTRLIKQNCNTEFMDYSNSYKEYKDLNDYLIHQSF